MKIAQNIKYGIISKSFVPIQKHRIVTICFKYFVIIVFSLSNKINKKRKIAKNRNIFSKINTIHDVTDKTLETLENNERTTR